MKQRKGFEGSGSSLVTGKQGRVLSKSCGKGRVFTVGPLPEHQGSGDSLIPVTVFQAHWAHSSKIQHYQVENYMFSVSQNVVFQIKDEIWALI